MSLMKKVMISVLVVVFGGGYLFLELYDDGSAERMEIPVELDEVESEEQLTNSELIAKLDKQEEKQKQQKAEEEREAKRNEGESELMNFDDLFNKKEPEEEKKEETEVLQAKVETKPLEVFRETKKEEVRQTPKRRPTTQSKPVEKVVEKSEPVASDPFGDSFGDSFGSSDVVEQVQQVSNQVNNNLVNEKVFIEASLMEGSKSIRRGSKVEFRILQPVTVNGHTYKKNQIFDAYVTNIGERIRFRVNVIAGIRGSYEIHDMDYEVGMYVGPEVLTGTIYEEVTEDTEDELLETTGYQQVDLAKSVIESAKRNARKHKRETIELRAQHPVLVSIN